MKWTLILVALLAGCNAHTSVHLVAGSPTSGVHVHAEGGAGLAALLGLAYFASAYRMESGPWPDASRPPPEMAPDRRINEQDCTKPLDWSQGNIRCK